MAINATVVRHGVDYRKHRHEEVATPVIAEQVESKPEPTIVKEKHAPVVDHIRMRKRLADHKTSSYAANMLNI